MILVFGKASNPTLLCCRKRMQITQSRKTAKLEKGRQTHHDSDGSPDDSPLFFLSFFSFFVLLVLLVLLGLRSLGLRARHEADGAAAADDA